MPQHVLRFWESRFAQIKPMKRGGGRRYYRPEDIDLLRGIRFLLYGEGYTIRGVQRILREQGVRFVQSVWREGANNLQPVLERENAEVEVEQGRAMFGLLSNFHDNHEQRPDEQPDEQQDHTDGEPALALNGPALNPAPLQIASDPPAARVVGPPLASNSLSHDVLHRLHTTLRDLNECRRILDDALKRDDQ